MNEDFPATYTRTGTSSLKKRSNSLYVIRSISRQERRRRRRRRRLRIPRTQDQRTTSCAKVGEGRGLLRPERGPSQGGRGGEKAISSPILAPLPLCRRRAWVKIGGGGKREGEGGGEGGRRRKEKELFSFLLFPPTLPTFFCLSPYPPHLFRLPAESRERERCVVFFKKSLGCNIYTTLCACGRRKQVKRLPWK